MPDLDILQSVARQYGAALTMLGKAIEACPETLWLSEDYHNRFWHIAYHSLFYTHFYLQAGEADLRPWTKHKTDYQYLGPRPWENQEYRRPETPYSRAELLEYHELCCREAEAKMPGLDLAAPSGFSWLPFNKLELQFYNIRHLQHHTGQLADRLRTTAGVGVAWARM